MNAKAVNDALEAAQKALDTLVDEEFKARRISSLRPLTLAQNAITLAQKHVTTAVERTAPKAAAEVAQTEAPATGKPSGKK